MVIPCTSILTHVNVHARGALVTRRVNVPGDLADGDHELTVEGVTALAEGGSLRAALPEDAVDRRVVVAVRSALVVPATGALTGASVDKVRAIQHRAAGVRSELGVLQDRRRRLLDLTFDPDLSARTGAGSARDITARTAEMLATSDMIASLGRDLDARVIELQETLRRLDEELAAAQLSDAQATTAERLGAGHPTRRVTVHLAGKGAVAWVDLTYAVPAARWWPVYTLRIQESGRRASWWIEALVAQLTGEDWTGVRLSLSTADLLFDARLPELASLRLGRAQQPAKRAWRPPPPGLDRMFAGYDKAFPPVIESVREQNITRGGYVVTEEEGGAPADVHALDTLSDDRAAAADEDVPTFYRQQQEAFARAELEEQAKEEAPRARRMPAPMKKAAAPGSVPMAAESMLMAQSAGMPKGGGLLGAVTRSSGMFGGGGAAYLARDEAPPEPAASEPADAWMDFDTLALKPASDRMRRGRLVREADTRTASAREEARGMIEGMAAPPGGRDPHQTRGVFDHRYATEGLAEIPSDGQHHRVSLGTADTTPTMRWRTVPRESPDVYREVELRNPFEAPLLAGPVDVYVDGSLLAVASVERIDRGGTMHVGMGLEERVRVARNVRMREEAVGILGGSTELFHDVSIELTSALGASALVEVVDRVPVSDDKTVEVATLRVSPEPERYTQADRGAAVRGALLWRVIVPAGAKSSIEYQYRITIPSKNEVVGGNRRD